MKAVSAVVFSLALASCSTRNEEAAEVAASNATAPTATASTTASSSEADYSDTGKQAAWIERGKDAIKAKLRDPDSAQFRNVAFHSSGGVPVACGEVNANNGFGGKAGYERFIAAGTSLAVLESEMTSSSELDTVWNRFCRG